MDSAALAGGGGCRGQSRASEQSLAPHFACRETPACHLGDFPCQQIAPSPFAFDLEIKGCASLLAKSACLHASGPHLLTDTLCFFQEQVSRKTGGNPNSYSVAKWALCRKSAIDVLPKQSLPALSMAIMVCIKACITQVIKVANSPQSLQGKPAYFKAHL